MLTTRDSEGVSYCDSFSCKLNMFGNNIHNVA